MNYMNESECPPQSFNLFSFSEMSPTKKIPANCIFLVLCFCFSG